MIKKEKIAKRYAEAFFEMVKDISESEKEINDITSIINKNPKILKFLSNPGIPLSIKKGIIEKLSSKKEVLSFILILIEKRKLNLLPLILTFFNKIMDEYKKRTRVLLTTAFSPPQELLEILIEKLKGILKTDIILDVNIEEEIIGGGILQIGSKKIDGSISSYLKRMETLWQK